MANRLILVFALLLLLPLLSAAPPVTTVTQFPQGLVIEYPAVEFLKEGKDFTFHFHVFNASTGLPLNSSINCTFHLYNSTGNHIFQGYDDTVSDVYDYAFKILAGNFTNGGSYYYITQCASATAGGSTEKAFEVKTTGVELTEARAIVYIGLLALIVLIILALPFIINMLPAENAKDQEGNLIQINWLKYLRPALWFVEWILALSLVFLASNLAFAYLVEETFANYLFTIFRIGMGITPILAILMFVWSAVKYVSDRNIQKLMSRGFGSNGY